MTRHSFRNCVVVFFNCRSWGMNGWSLGYWILCCIFRFIRVLLPRAYTTTIQKWIELCDPLRVLPFIVFLRLREILRGQTSIWQGCQSSEGIPSSWDEVPPRNRVDELFATYLGVWICYLGLTTKRDAMHRWILFFCCIQNTVLTNQDHREILAEGHVSITEI